MIQQRAVQSQQAKSVSVSLPSVEELTEMIDNVHFEHAWEDGWEVYNYCPLTGNTWLTKTPESPFAGVRLPKMELLEVAQKMLASSQKFEIAPEVLELIHDKGVAAKVLSWDQFCYDSIPFTPEEIKAVSIQYDVVKFLMTNGGVIPLGIEQFIAYFNQIKAIEAERDLIEDEVQSSYNPIPVIKSAKESGDFESCGIREVWDCSVKAGYVLHFGNWWYAVHESYKLVGGGSEVRYSWSRHSNESLAESELLEQLLPW